MPEQNDDAARALVQRAYRADPELPHLNITIELASVLAREDPDLIKADQEIIAILKLAGFRGPPWMEFTDALARYGRWVMKCWLVTGRIFFLCQARGFELERPARDKWVRADLEGLANETVAHGFNRLKRALEDGVWNPGRGVTIRTFFMGACIAEFPNLHQKWWLNNSSIWSKSAPLESGIVTHAPRDFGEVVAGKIGIREDQRAVVSDASKTAAIVKALRNIDDEVTDAVVLLDSVGYSHGEIGEFLDVVPRDVENRLRRQRQSFRSEMRPEKSPEKHGDVSLLASRNQERATGSPEDPKTVSSDDAIRRTKLHQAKAYIEAHLEEPDLNPVTIAASQHISVRLLYKLFSTEGQTVAGWMRQRRLARVRDDLLNPRCASAPITAIAGRWGFANEAHFSRVFKATYGTSPSDYRQRTRPAPELDPENAELVRLAHSTLARTGATEGAAVRDTDGRTHTGVAASLPPVLTALQAAVAAAVASGATGLEAAVLVGGEIDDTSLVAVRELGPSAPVLLVDQRGNVSNVLHVAG